MKKFLLFLLATFFIASPAIAYVVQPGDTLWDLYGSNWRKVAEENNIYDPTLLQVGQVINDGKLGATIPTSPALVDTYLVSNISKTDTSMTLAKGTDRDGNTLLGYMCFVLDVNTPQVEYVCGSVSSTAVTSMIRAVSVSNPNATTTNAFPHRRLASVQIADYPILQILSRMVGGQDSTGSGTFIVGDDTNSIKLQNTTTSIKYIYAWGNAGNPFLRYNGTNWQFSDDGVNTVNLVTGGGGLSPSSSLGIQIVDSKIGINASSTTGGAFDSSGKYYQAIGNALEYKGNAIAVSTSTIVTQIATSTPTASMIPIASSSGYLNSFWIYPNSYSFFGTGSDGDVTISASTTLTSDKFYNNLVISDGVVVNTNNYRIFVRNNLTFLGTAKLASNGGNASNGATNTGATGGAGGAGGAGVPKGYFATSTAGVAGGAGGNGGGTFGDVGIAGNQGTSSTVSILNTNGVAGGAGTDACTGGRLGAAGSAGVGSNLGTFLYKYDQITTSTYSLNATNNFTFPVFYRLSSSATTHTLFGAVGSGSGGGGAGFQDAGCTCTATGASGGGGSGGTGGIIYVQARAINTTSSLFAEAKGGNGGNGGASPCAGAPTLGLGGGGGGGNGGLIVLVYNTLTGSGTVTTTAGAGGYRGDGTNQASSGNVGKYLFVNLGL